MLRSGLRRFVAVHRSTTSDTALRERLCGPASSGWCVKVVLQRVWGRLRVLRDARRLRSRTSLPNSAAARQWNTSAMIAAIKPNVASQANALISDVTILLISPSFRGGGREGSSIARTPLTKTRQARPSVKKEPRATHARWLSSIGICQPAALLTDGSHALGKSYNSLPPRDSRYVMGLHRPSYLASIVEPAAGDDSKYEGNP
jgi:hypothetical protein